MNESVQIGSRLGLYQIEAEIGRGGMGAVYKGYDARLDRHVAVKVLAPHLVWQKDFVERFMREARAAARLRHPNIVHIYDVGQEGGWYYYVMEYLEGQTLTALIRQRGPLPPEEVVALLRPLAEALDYAHANGLVHRDIKPSNVVVGRAGRVTLTDFGIARAAQDAGLTATGTLVGTPEYISPEQTQGTGVDARSDQYSLAVVAYEMLSGHVPFQADSTLALMYKVVHEPPPPIRSVRRDLPQEVEQVLEKGLAKAPGARYATVVAFVDALQGALAGKRSKPRPEAAAKAAVPAVAAGAAGRAEAGSPRTPSRQPGQATAPAGQAAPDLRSQQPSAAAGAPARRQSPVVWILAALAVVLALSLGGVLLAVSGSFGNRPAGSGDVSSHTTVIVVSPAPGSGSTGTAPGPTVTLQAPATVASGQTAIAVLPSVTAPPPTWTPSEPATEPVPVATDQPIVLTATSTEAAPATNTPRPAATPTPVPPRKTPKPTQVPPATAKFAAPALLSPADGRTFTGQEQIILEWQPVGQLPADAYYEVVVAYSPASDPAATWYDDTPWTKEPRWALSEHSYLPDLSADQKFRWSVQVMRKTGQDAQGRPSGVALSPMSAVRTLIWNPSPGGGGGGGEGQATHEPEPP